MLSRVIDGIPTQFAPTIAATLGVLLTFQPNGFAEEQTMSVIARASAGPLACEIRRVGAGESVQLTGVVLSAVPVSGSARLLLTKTGPSGISNVNQGSAFDLASGAELHVSHVTISLRRDDRVVVDFVATSKNGLACHATSNLAL